MKKLLFPALLIILTVIISCTGSNTNSKELWAEDILGNPEYQAISFGGYRHDTRDIVPIVSELKEDMKILHAMGIRIIRTYNTREFEETTNLLKAISELKTELPKFEMYVMLGAWIDCKDARTDNPVHNAEALEKNTAEISAAIEFAKIYPDIVKIIAVGNETMVHWATGYFVEPDIILKWVLHLQELKNKGEIDPRIWITSSDNFASWGGGDSSYHKEALTDLISAVDYVSMHTYPFHDTHYNPAFWTIPPNEKNLSPIEQTNEAIKRATEYAKSQYASVKSFIESKGLDKALHIGETGWASRSNSFYGNGGSEAADEYKEKMYYDAIRSWTDSAGITCFYFEAFNEKWKDASNPAGSENHFGLISTRGEAKYALWQQVDDGVFDGLTRGGNPITKSYGGDIDKLMQDVLPPPIAKEAEAVD